MGLSIEEKYFKKIEDYMNVNEMIFPKNSKMSSLYKKLNEKNSNKISLSLQDWLLNLTNGIKNVVVYMVVRPQKFSIQKIILQI